MPDPNTLPNLSDERLGRLFDMAYDLVTDMGFPRAAAQAVDRCMDAAVDADYYPEARRRAIVDEILNLAAIIGEHREEFPQ